MKSRLTPNALFHRLQFMIVLIAIISLPLSGSGHSSPAEITWEHIYPKPAGDYLVSIANGPPGFVALARTGEILFSEDGLQWSRGNDPSHVGTWFTCVRYTNDRFMAVGNLGAVFFSFDGRTWTKAEVPSTGFLRTCAGANGVFVAAGDDSTLLVSTNGTHWEARLVPLSFSSIAAGETNWIALGGGMIYSSDDLVNWTVVWNEFGGLPRKSVIIVTPGVVLNSVTIGAGRFIVTGGSFHDIGGVSGGSRILYSDDAGEWQTASYSSDTPFGEILDCTYANGWFVAVRPGAILTSTDGSTWSMQEISRETALRAVAASPAGRFVAVGDKGAILVSDDAQTWHALTQNPREYLSSIEYANGRFVAVGGSPWYLGESPGTAAVFTSKDGRQWRSSLTNLQNKLSSAAYGRGTWVVTGDDGQIFASPDANHWINASIRNTTHDLYRVTFGNGRFIAFAAFRDTVYTSRDGITWTRREIPGTSATPAAHFLNGRFVAPGTNGLVMFSHDGLRWRTRPTPATQDLACVTYAKGRYVAGGDSVIVSSRNGIKWQVIPVPFSIHHVKCVNGLFIAIGSQAQTLISRDALTWEQIATQGGDAISLVASGNGILVGASGLTLYRASVEPHPE